MEEEEARMAAAMREHPEYADLWARLDRVTDAEVERDGTNPILHVLFHQIVENQLAAAELEEVGEVVEALIRAGVPRHEAVHRVAAVVAEELNTILKEKRPFNEADYSRKVRALTEDAYG